MKRGPNEHKHEKLLLGEDFLLTQYNASQIQINSTIFKGTKNINLKQTKTITSKI